MQPSKHHSSDPAAARKGSAVNRLSVDRQRSVLSLLVEGCSLRSVERVTGVHRDTAMRLTARAGRACQRLLDFRMRGLRLEHIQADEIWTFVLKKQAHLEGDEHADEGIGDQFLFVALDEETKLIPSFRLGKRNGENTEAFMLDLSRRLAMPEPAAVAPGAEPVDNRPLISTDGWAAYPGAVDLAFANTARYGIIIKDYQESEQPGRYGPPVMTYADRRPVTKGLDPYAICTSHVERNNLSIRTFMRRFTRLALGFSKKVENLAAAVALHVAHYNYCRFHRTIRSTPAMAAGIAGHPWTVEELMEEARVG
jgi:IS1 family transposase